jgi:diadenosine tetraphosphate (Ap4A) HIT family hydrolase
MSRTTDMTLEEAQTQGLAPWDDLEQDLQGVRVYRDRYPVTPGHLLFVPETNTPYLVQQAFGLAYLRGLAMVRNGHCDAYNVGINQGTAAGQTVMYPHIHLIPRRRGDCADPVGGVRGVIPGQANYRDPGYVIPQDK